MCRFFNGFFAGAPASIVFSYLGEFHAPKQRVQSICYAGLFFTTSWLLLPVISYLIIPLHIDLSSIGFETSSSWRIFLLVLATPELLAAIWLLRLPESPKYIESRGRDKEAIEILRLMFAKNYGVSKKEFPVNSLLNNNLTTTKLHGVECKGRTARMLSELVRQCKKLFSPPLLQMTVLVSFIMFGNMFG